VLLGFGNSRLFEPEADPSLSRKVRQAGDAIIPSVQEFLNVLKKKNIFSLILSGSISCFTIHELPEAEMFEPEKHFISLIPSIPIKSARRRKLKIGTACASKSDHLNNDVTKLDCSVSSNKIQ